MKDIVVQLRNWALREMPSDMLEEQAADEIERLRDLADDLYYVIHCANDDHRILAERRYLAVKRSESGW